MRGEVHILVNCPITTFLKEKQHSALCTCPQVSGVCSGVCVAIVFLCNVRAVNKQTSMYIAHPTKQKHKFKQTHTQYVRTRICANVLPL